MNPRLRDELLALRDEDLRVRQELLEAGELAGGYHPRMEAVHRRNAERLRALIAEHGWPAADLAGEDGAEAAWLIAQHAIGEPAFQRRALELLRAAADEGRVPQWHVAYLDDRIAMFEGRPQRYGTQGIDDPVDGRPVPWTLADPEHVDEWRRAAGLGPLQAVPPRPPLSPEEQARLAAQHAAWQEWLIRTGWRSGPS